MNQTEFAHCNAKIKIVPLCNSERLLGNHKNQKLDSQETLKDMLNYKMIIKFKVLPKQLIFSSQKR